MSALWITLTVVLFFGTIIAHEAGHYVSMRRAGVRIHSAGIGFPFPPTFTIYRKKNPDGTVTKFQLSPWVLGAFVRAEEKDEQRITELPYRQFTWIMGSGVVINLVLGVVLLGFSALVEGSWLRCLICLAIATALWFTRRLFAAYIVPVLGFPALALFMFGCIAAVQDRTPIGVVGTAQVFGMASTFQLALLLGGALSITLGLMNMIPLFPFDGGRIFGRVLARFGLSPRAILGFEVVTSTLALGTIMFSLMTDILFA
jgi:membrane-associated protease RseP (regulator of RpoE activity)